MPGRAQPRAQARALSELLARSTARSSATAAAAARSGAPAGSSTSTPCSRIDADLQAAARAGPAHAVGELRRATRERIIAAVGETSIVRLPAAVAEPFEVYVNGVRQEPGVDYEVATAMRCASRAGSPATACRAGAGCVGAFGIGTYRQDDSVDVRYERDGRRDARRAAGDRDGRAERD